MKRNSIRNSLFFMRSVLLTQVPYRHLFKRSLEKFYSSYNVASGVHVPTFVPIEMGRDVTISTMSRGNLNIVFDWAKREGWNPGLHDLEAYYEADPQGFRMMWVDGKPAASLASIKYSDSFSFLGLYIVQPEFRGQGYGKLLWDVSMHTVRACDSFALNGVMEQQQAYQKGGFEFSNLNTRWQSTLFNPKITRLSSRTSSEFPLTREVSLKDIVDFDCKASSVVRPNFWQKIINDNPGSFFLASCDHGELKGFGVLSPCVDGYKFGPMYANNPNIAEDLIVELIGCARSKSGLNVAVQLDTPQTNPRAALFADKMGFKQIFDTARMYKGGKPDMTEDVIYGLTSLEIG